MIIDNVEVVVKGYDEFSADELKNYVDYVKARVELPVKKIIVEFADDDFVNLSYVAQGDKFERIRRITGYLTGVMDTWNDAKKAEEHDRVKHDTRI